MIFFNIILLYLLCNIKSVFLSPVTTKLGNNAKWNTTHVDNLRHDLLLNYDKFSRPAQHYNSTKVSFGFTLNHFEVNEMRSTFTMHAWIQLAWLDEKLKWNPDDYGNLHLLHFAEHEIWQPDISIYNSASTIAINTFVSTHFVVISTGQVQWVPPSQVTVFCNYNFKYWPYDTQTCSIKFGSWVNHEGFINLEVSNNSTEVDQELLIDNTEWKIVDTKMELHKVFYRCCKEPYPAVLASITIARKSPSYKAVVVAPALLIVIMILTSFLLPPNSGEKIFLNSGTIIIICLFFLYFTQKLPAMGSNTPLLIIFYNSCLFLTSLALIESILVIFLCKSRHSKNVPWIIKKILTGKFGKILALHSYINQSNIIPTSRITAEEMRDHQVSDFDDNSPEDEHHIIGHDNRTKNTNQQDWILFAAAIDRISFCFYSLLFSILVLIYLV